MRRLNAVDDRTDRVLAVRVHQVHVMVAKDEFVRCFSRRIPKMIHEHLDELRTNLRFGVSSVSCIHYEVRLDRSDLLVEVLEDATILVVEF
jgi:hypothetical protein